MSHVLHLLYTHVTDEMKQEVNTAITNMGKALSNKKLPTGLAGGSSLRL